MLDDLRILYLTADATLYGANKSLLNLLSSADLKKENYLIVTPKYGEFNKELDRLKIRNYVIKYYWECGFRDGKLITDFKFLYRYLEKELVNLRAKKALIKTVKQYKINLIHSNSSVISIGFDVAKRLAIKHVWHIREFIKLDYGLTLYESEKHYFKKVQRSDVVICVSKSLAEYFQLSGKANVIYNAVAKRSEITEPLLKESYFLYCGSLTRHKGLHKALPAFAKLCETDKKIKLKIAGEFVRKDEYYNFLLDLIEKLALTDRIEFLGYSKEARMLMSKAVCLLVCSDHEGMGRVTAEAMLCNCLVIGYDDKAGTSELIEHEKTGLLFDTNEELASAMRFALQDKEAVMQIVKQAREFAANNFTEEIFRQRLLDVYENLTRRN